MWLLWSTPWKTSSPLQIGSTSSTTFDHSCRSTNRWNTTIFVQYLPGENDPIHKICSHCQWLNGLYCIVIIVYITLFDVCIIMAYFDMVYILMFSFHFIYLYYTFQLKTCKIQNNEHYKIQRNSYIKRRRLNNNNTIYWQRGK